MRLPEILLGVIFSVAISIALTLASVAIHAADFRYARIAFWVAGTAWVAGYLAWLMKSDAGIPLHAVAGIASAAIAVACFYLGIAWTDQRQLDQVARFRLTQDVIDPTAAADGKPFARVRFRVISGPNVVTPLHASDLFNSNHVLTSDELDDVFNLFTKAVRVGSSQVGVHPTSKISSKATVLVTMTST